MIEDEDEPRIRAKAYELWESEGRPEGRAERHWEEAREIVALKDSFSSTLQPLEETTDDPVEPSIAFENQGEFPEMTDLGEGARGPSWENAEALADAETPGNTPPVAAASGKTGKPRGETKR
ncbi:DUF2934 domain-containing protein [Aureimonas frigidaquae]|uniref:DUF2934 domain-containing protein n=1 Tax=Aureimonas frigidaquae TaxID=424757 RepID=A0A0P0Z050_9HYPH|nr:DUF2934 domain-containing protein [Aureimonas frigidaquae]BAT27242.1 hypothetical protein [Aureimonas frigidaquae]